MSTARKLRLGPLPRLESTKLTFTCSTSLRADLDRYAALHAQTYGEAVDAAVLIPYMLEAFMAGDSRRCMNSPIVWVPGGATSPRHPPRSTDDGDGLAHRLPPKHQERAAWAARFSFWRFARAREHAPSCCVRLAAMAVPGTLWTVGDGNGCRRVCCEEMPHACQEFGRSE